MVHVSNKPWIGVVNGQAPRLRYQKDAYRPSVDGDLLRHAGRRAVENTPAVVTIPEQYYRPKSGMKVKSDSDLRVRPGSVLRQKSGKMKMHDNCMENKC